MKKTIKIEFNENVKSVVASTKIEYEFDSDKEILIGNETIMKEAKDLYEEASKYSLLKTQQKGI